MKLNWFSPLPPARSEVARLTAALLPHLSQRAQVTVWSSQPEWDRDVERSARVRHYDPVTPPWREISEADVTFYQMGNDPRYHEAIWQISRQHPGVVILHDLKLQHFFAGLVTETRALDWHQYLELVEQHHSAAGRELAESFVAGVVNVSELAEHCPMTGAAIEGALAVVVHSVVARETISNTSSIPILYLPLGAGTPPPVHGKHAKGEGTNSNPYRIIMFGFLGPNRQLPALLRALARFPERSRFRLDVYGTMEGAEKVEELICRLNLSDAVALHGFVPEQELNHALGRADLAVNMRYPSMGEASASQLQLWQYAVPSLVTRTAWYATLPEETVAFVRPAHEVEDIQAHLAGFLEDPEKYRVLGRAGQEHVNEHCTSQSYVEGLMEIAHRAPEFYARWTAGDLAHRAVAAMNDWGILGAPSLSEGVAAEIQALVRKLPPPERVASLR